MSRNAKWTLFAWLLLALLGAGQLSRTQMATDLTAFIPATEQGILNTLSQMLTEGSAARIWLLSLRNDEPQELADISRRFAENLRNNDKLAAVHNGAGDTFDETRGIINKYRYLIDRRVEQGLFEQASLAEQLEQRLQDLRSPWSSFAKHSLATDPTASSSHILMQQLKPGHAPRKHAGVWFSDDLSQALLLIETHARGMAMDEQQRILGQINKAFAQEAGESTAELTLSGPALFALNSRDRIRSEARKLSLLASGLLLVFAAWAFPSVSRLILLALPLVLGVLSGTAMVSLWFGSIHGITLAFGITLLGMAIDYPIHLFAHQGKRETLRDSILSIWPTLRLGMITTVLAYLTFSLSAIPGLAQLGLLSATGLLTAALATRYLLPALELPGTNPPNRLQSLAGRIRSPNLSLRLLLPLGLLLSLAVFSTHPGQLWSEDIADLSPISNELREYDRQLRKQLGAPEPRFLVGVTGNSIQTVLERQEKLRQQLERAVDARELDDFEMAADILPSRALQRSRQERLPSEEVLIKRLRSALTDLPFKQGAFTPFVTEVQAARSLQPMTREQLADTPLEMRLDSLLLPSSSNLWLGLVKLVNVHQPAELEQRILAAAIRGANFYDVKGRSSQLLKEFREDVLQRVIWASLSIFLLILVILRDSGKAIRVSLGVALAVLIAYSAPLWLGERLNLFHLASLILVAGIGIDYGLFFARADAWGTHLQTRIAVLICVISSVIVFAILGGSQIPVLHSIGLTVASGVTAAFLLAWLLSREEKAD